VESTCEIQVLSFRAYVRGPRHLLQQVRRMRPISPTWAAAPHTTPTVVFDLQPSSPRPGWHQLVHDGVPLVTTRDPGELLLCLQRALNGAAVAQLGQRYLLIHAGAVAYAGQGLLLPAASGSGKSTLVAGLVAAGFQYLSDEVAVLELDTGRLLPFGNCLGIKVGAQRVLRALYPLLLREVSPRRLAGEAIWHLPPPRHALPAGPVVIRHVLLPRYVRGARPLLQPLSRAQALPRLLGQTADAGAHGADGLRALVGVLRGAECYTFTTGALQDSVDVVRQLVEASTGRTVS
jgi:hypothetical protein